MVDMLKEIFLDTEEDEDDEESEEEVIEEELVVDVGGRQSMAGTQPTREL